MAQNRFYSSVAAKTTLVGTINASVTTLAVASVTGFPASLPFTLILERDTANEEVITVTGVSTLTLTVARAQDGTTGVSHTTGAVVEHGVSARDYNEPQAHIAATGAVHGLSGSIVGTTDTQTLTNKTLTSPAIATISNTGTLTLPTSTDTLVGRATTDTLTNKTLSAPTVTGALAGPSWSVSSGGVLAAANYSGGVQSYSPTHQDLNTASSVVGYYVKLASDLYWYHVLVAAGGSSTAGGSGILIGLPGIISSSSHVGQWVRHSGNSNLDGGWTLGFGSASTVEFHHYGTPGGASLKGSDIGFANGDVVEAWGMVYI